MKRLLFAIAAIAAILPALQSCSDDNTPATAVYQTIATFTGNNGNTCSFAYQAIDDSPLITLTAEGNVEETETQKPGMRCFLTYTLGVNTPPNHSGNVNILSIAKVYQDTVESVPTIPADFTDPYSVVTLTRSGLYLNLYCVVPEVGFDNRSFTIVADQSTLTSDYPQIYLSMSTKPDATPSMDTRAIGSFFIGPVWQLATAKGVDVHVSSEANPSNSVFRFEKQ